MEYIKRIVDAELDQLLGDLAAVVLEDQKGVGKTESAKRRAKTQFAMDDPAQRAIASADVGQLLGERSPFSLTSGSDYRKHGMQCVAR